MRGAPRPTWVIAMGTGTDVAMQSAAVTLVKGDLRASCKQGAVRSDRRHMKQNLGFAFLYNVLAFRSPRRGTIHSRWLLSPMIAGARDESARSSVSSMRCDCHASKPDL